MSALKGDLISLVAVQVSINSCPSMTSISVEGEVIDGGPISQRQTNMTNMYVTHYFEYE